MGRGGCMPDPPMGHGEAGLGGGGPRAPTEGRRWSCGATE